MPNGSTLNTGTVGKGVVEFSEYSENAREAGFALYFKFLLFLLCSSFLYHQRKEALTNDNLPEEYRMALAKALQDDLFFKVCCNLFINHTNVLFMWQCYQCFGFCTFFL